MAALHFSLQPGFDGLVLRVKVCHIRNKILDDIGMWQGVDLHGCRRLVDEAQASKSVASVDVHGAGTADSFSAGATKGEGRVGIFDLDEGIENHGATSAKSE